MRCKGHKSNLSLKIQLFAYMYEYLTISYEKLNSARLFGFLHTMCLYYNMFLFFFSLFDLQKKT